MGGAVTPVPAFADPVDGFVEVVEVCAGLVGVGFIFENERAVFPVGFGGVHVAFGGDDAPVVRSGVGCDAGG